MKHCLLFLVVLPFSNAFASGTFGPGVKFDSHRGVDQKGCEASAIINVAYINTQVNIVDGTAAASWSCKGVAAGKAEEARCPFPQYLLDSKSEFKCFSNDKVKGSFACVSKPRSEVINVKYGDSKRTKETQPRFDEMLIAFVSPEGSRSDIYFQMDSSGCMVKKVRGEEHTGTSTFDISVESCSKLLDAVVNCELIYPDPELRSSLRYCQRQVSSEYVSAVGYKINELNLCQKYLPAFMGNYSSRKPASVKSK